jgi:DNA-binding NtrC family response regulator
MEKISEQQRQLAILQSEITSRQVELPLTVQNGEPREFSRDVMIGNSPAIRRVLSTAQKIAGSESSVLVRGESGTGKELLAEVLHGNSPRRNGPLVCVHCAALSQNLLESELFGHVKGAFTGAHQNRIGRFEAASGGTLFLDEIGDISLETQIKLLRVLQERSFEPVGGTRTIQVDVRLVTATHQDLEKLIAAGRFREDLYYRLNVISVTLPPLRERREDILELALHFLGGASQRLGKRVTHMSDEVLATLERHTWPGNIRELQNTIERAVVLADSEEISIRDLPPEITGASRPSRRIFEATPSAESTRPIAPVPGPSNGDSPHGAGSQRTGSHGNGSNGPAESSEREMLVRVLEECNGNKAEAARKLGIPRSTYFSKLKKYAIEV